MFWATNAYAMGGGGGADAGMMSFIPLILMFAVFYFLLIRPQQKRAKEHQNMLNDIKRGDEVLTAGGIYGRVLETAEQYLTVDLGETKVKLSRGAVSSVVGQSKVVDKQSRKADKPSRKADKENAGAEETQAAETPADGTEGKEKE